MQVSKKLMAVGGVGSALVLRWLWRGPFKPDLSRAKTPERPRKAKPS